MTWLINNWQLVLRLTGEHVVLSVPPILLGLAIALPLGWVAHHFTAARGAILASTGLLYTIPSLALFVILPPVLGISFLSPLNLTIALTIYALAILVRAVSDALGSVDQDVKDSATAMGFGPWRRFFQVELPLAGPTILAGLRVAAVSTISLVTIGILIGVESLGYLFTNGSQRRIVAEILTGVVAVMGVALAVDYALLLAGRVVMPWAPQLARRGSRRRGRHGDSPVGASGSGAASAVGEAP